MVSIRFNFPEPAHRDSGVYCIHNGYTKDMYVGSSIHLEKRMKEHLRVLRKGQHHSRHLQRAWDKHGEHAFKFSVLGYYDRAGALEVEQWWLDNATCAYNGSRVATRPDHSDEVRARIKLAVAEKWKNPDSRVAAAARTKKVLQDRPELVARFTAMAKSSENVAKIRAAHRARNRNILAFGKAWCVRELAEHFKVDYSLLKSRVRAGWDPEVAVSTPRRPKTPNGTGRKKVPHNPAKRKSRAKVKVSS